MITDQKGKKMPMRAALLTRELDAMVKLINEISLGLGEDHKAQMLAEGSWRDHRRTEPGCSYCGWIKRAETIARDWAKRTK